MRTKNLTTRTRTSHQLSSRGRVTATFLALCTLLVWVAAGDSAAGETFEDTDIVDLSIYQTSSKVQAPLGTCTAFSMVAAIEAAYTHAYCDNPLSPYSRHGYCDRYQILKAAALAPFTLEKAPWLADNQNQLDLSELYYIHRVLTAWTTAPGHNHISGNTVNMLDGIERVLPGNAHLIVNNLVLPEESTAPYINANEAHKYLQAVFAEKVNQELIDDLEFNEAELRYVDDQGAQVSRPYVPREARETARFGVTGLSIMRGADIPDLVDYLERRLFEGSEVVMDGVVPGHSMLLIGYDRKYRRFFFKDHGHNFVFVSYADVLEHKDGIMTTVVTAIRSYPSYPSYEEMWLGMWKFDRSDGLRGNLVLRTVRIPPNALMTTADIFGEPLEPSATDLWTRVGTFFRNADPEDRWVVYGRLNNSKEGIGFDLYIDLKRRENYSADSPEVLAAGYDLPASSRPEQVTLWAGLANGHMFGEGRTNGGDLVVITPHSSQTVFDTRAIEARNILTGHFNDDDKADIMVWKKNWSSAPTYFFHRAGAFDVTNENDPLDLINDHNNKIVGDFDDDGLDDVALWRVNTWVSTPIYFSTGNGAFDVTNEAHGENQNFINSNAKKLVGDFDGDGDHDIALWQPGWTKTPVYFSNGDGAFTVTNVDHSPGQNWINDSETRKMVGDFDGDGDDDVALWRIDTWGSTPVYFSNGDGAFTVINVDHSPGQNWINDSETRKMVGDFDGDGDDDIALSRRGWFSTPIYFSNGDGSFTVTNQTHRVSKNWINDPATHKMVGDFDGDGRIDIALWKEGWRSTPVYLARPGGRFVVYNYSHLASKNWINSPDTVKIIEDFDGDGRTDIALRLPGAPGTPIYFASIRRGEFVITNVPHAPGEDFINW